MHINFRIFQDGAIGFLSGYFSQFLQIIVPLILKAEEIDDEIYQIPVAQYSRFGNQKTPPFQIEFPKPFTKDEMNEFISVLKNDPEQRFYIEILHHGNPFLQIKVLDPATGSSFLLTIKDKIVQLIAISKYQKTSIKALLGSLFLLARDPKEEEELGRLYGDIITN